MSPEAPRDQPSGVAVEEIPRAPEASVVTSDTPPVADTAGSPSATGEPAGAKDPNSQPGDDKPTRPKRDRSAERRMGRLKRKLAKSDERNTANESKISDLQTQIDGLKTTAPPPVPPPKPERKDYPNDEAYARGYAKWAKDSTAPAAVPPTETPPAGKPAAKPAPHTPPDPAFEDKELKSFNAKGVKKFGDEFLEAMQDEDTAVNLTMGEYIFDSEYGPDIYLHLANNQEESRKIFDSSAHRAVKMLDDLEAKAKKGALDIPEGQLQVADPPDTGEPDAGKAGTKSAGGKRPGGTKAPEPPSDTKGGTRVHAKNPEEEDMDEYAARRDREERKRRGVPPT